MSMKHRAAEAAHCAGDQATPTKVKGISFFTGAKPFASFKTEIDNALARLR